MRNYNPRLITARRSYTISEICSLLGVNRRTCGRWIKDEGLEVLEEKTSPLLIMGGDLINFIKRKKGEGKTPLKENEFFCVKCRNAVRAKTGSEQIIKTGKRIGKANMDQCKKTGVCEHCNTTVNKFLGVYQRD